MIFDLNKERGRGRRRFAQRFRWATKHIRWTKGFGVALLLIGAAAVGAAGALVYELAPHLALKVADTPPPSVLKPRPSEGQYLLRGPASVLDGDTLAMDGRRIRLANFDAPELTDPGGAKARDVLRDLVAGKTVECHGEKLDRWQRLIATCSIHGADLGDSLRGRGVIEQRRDQRPVMR